MHPGRKKATAELTLEATTLNDMERSGHVLTGRQGREKRFWLRRDEWRFLIA